VNKQYFFLAYTGHGLKETGTITGRHFNGKATISSHIIRNQESAEKGDRKIINTQCTKTFQATLTRQNHRTSSFTSPSTPRITFEYNPPQWNKQRHGRIPTLKPKQSIQSIYKW